MVAFALSSGLAFQHLLAYCLSVHELRQTAEFSDFLYTRELCEVQDLLHIGQIEDATGLLENTYFVMDKLYIHSGELSDKVLKALCTLTACCDAASNITDAQKYAEKAIELISSTSSQDIAHKELVVPLLVLSVRLYAIAGDKDRRELDTLLQAYTQQKHINLAKQPTLLELVMQKDFLTTSEMT